jgi:hypothetical protein
MKTKHFLIMAGLVVPAFFISVKAQTTIYSGNGTLSSARTVTMSGNSLTFNPTNANSQWFMNGTTGFVGLGTLSPLDRLHVASGRILIGTNFTTWNETASNWSLKASNGIVVSGMSSAGVGAANPTIDLQNQQNGNMLQMAMVNCTGCYSYNAVTNDLVVRGNTAGSFIITNEGNGGIKFATKEGNSFLPKVQMMIDKLGNIGIGTGATALAANEKLAVNGLIHTKEVKVDLLNWPDYVFAADYKLPTLDEVEQDIKQNGHLPNVPSARTIEQNGLELGAMSKIQQEKIEELTLYILELHKTNETQNKKIEELTDLVQKLADKK